MAQTESKKLATPTDSAVTSVAAELKLPPHSPVFDRLCRQIKDCPYVPPSSEELTEKDKSEIEKLDDVSLLVGLKQTYKSCDLTGKSWTGPLG